MAILAKEPEHGPKTTPLAIDMKFIASQALLLLGVYAKGSNLPCSATCPNKSRSFDHGKCGTSPVEPGHAVPACGVTP